MSKLISIGEALIDFIPKQKGILLKDVSDFTRVAGGAPANVAATVSKLGGESLVLTKLGNDSFGDFIIDELQRANVNTMYIKRTSDANTALAFVSLSKEGQRDFSFYRNPSADMLLNQNEISKQLFKTGDVLHFCSVDLIESPMKYAHEKAIEYALSNDVIISFDPNLRFPLWKDLDIYKKTILEYIPYAHLLKISNDELEFITGEKDITKGINSLYVGNVKIIILTCGADGVYLFKKNQSRIFVPSFRSEVKDTTGAGDSFIGGIIFQILKNGVCVDSIDKLINEDYLQFSHAISSIVVSRYGAIPALPNYDEVKAYLKIK